MIKEKGKATKNHGSLFVNKTNASKKEIENGNSLRINKEDLKQFLGLK